MISVTTEPTARIENTGTARDASGQRSAPASRSASTVKARPPTHTEAAAMCTTSAYRAIAPLVRAWPAAESVGRRRTAGTRMRSPKMLFDERLTRNALGAITAASPSCQRNASPNLVWSTESTVSQRNASLKPNPPATAPCRTMQRMQATMRPRARPARMR
jgi:hypothetical protein